MKTKIEHTTENAPAEIEKTLTELEELLSSFTEEQINIVPFAGSWTPGQLARHLIKSGNGFVKVLNGAAQDTEKQPDELVERIKSDFLDFSTKMTSPEFVAPENRNYEKDDLLRAVAKIKADLKQAALTLDLSKTCAFELPVYGKLTRLEAIYFVVYHAQRHLHQLRNIRASLKRA